jgi:hypothetical protein
MKKLLLSVFALIFLLSIVSACDSSCPTNMTRVTGIIYDSEGIVVHNAEITAECNGITMTDQTSASGWYSVYYPQSECEAGAIATVTAVKGELTGTDTGIVKSGVKKSCLDLNLAIIKITMVPEFGAIIGMLTIISAVGVFFFVRRE